jgi:hypothetical protein
MPKVLTEQQVRDFEEQGYLSPVRAMSAERAAEYRGKFEARTAATLPARPTAASGPRHDNLLTTSRSAGKVPTHVRR